MEPDDEFASLITSPRGRRVLKVVEAEAQRMVEHALGPFRQDLARINERVEARLLALSQRVQQFIDDQEDD
jgi:hypothetical protein